MTTRFYLHATNSTVSGTLPLTKQSSQTYNGSIDSVSTSKRTMNTTIGTAQTSLASASNAIGFGTTGILFVARFISAPIYQTSVAANTWNFSIAGKTTSVADYHPNAGSGGVPVCLYVWRPSSGTKVGTIFDSSTASVTAPSSYTTEICTYTTFSGSAVSGVQNGDVIILELLIKAVNNSNTFQYTNYFDGTTATTTNNTTVSNFAEFIETPENINFNASSPVVNNLFIVKALFTADK